MTSTTLRTLTLWGLRIAAAMLFVWIPLLAVSLKEAGSPRMATLAWVGLDVAELVGLVATLDCARRDSDSLRTVARLTSALFLFDAVVDTATSSASPTSLATATLMALLAELPIAAACGLLGGVSPYGWRTPTPVSTAEYPSR